MKLILVVDDDADMRFILRLLLERGGFDVVEAGDGFEALRVVREKRPDIVVTDWRMPVMDGAELMRRLRTEEVTADIPLILVTAHAVLPETSRLADVLIPKPFAPERVVEAVNRLIGGRHQTVRKAVPDREEPGEE